jgi:hypothetical protein
MRDATDLHTSEKLCRIFDAARQKNILLIDLKGKIFLARNSQS